MKYKVFILFMLLPASLFAENYFLNFNSGTDTANCGSQGVPCKTINWCILCNQPKPGDSIKIQPGIYRSLGSIKDQSIPKQFDGAPGTPIILEGIKEVEISDPNARIGIGFTGNSDDGAVDYWTVRNLTFTGTQTSIFRTWGKGLRFTRITFKNIGNPQNHKTNGPRCIVSNGGSPGIEIDHCIFKNIVGMGIQLAGSNTIAAKIHHNTFQDFPAIKGIHDHSCILVGGGSLGSGDYQNHQIYANTFIRCRGDNEVIANKSAGNRYFENLFVDSSYLSLRYGTNCRVYQNQFIDTNCAIAIHDSGHKIISNQLQNIRGDKAIWIRSGLPGDDRTNPAKNVIIRNNRIENTQYNEAVIYFGDVNQKYTDKIENIKIIENQFSENANKIFFNRIDNACPAESIQWLDNDFAGFVLCSGACNELCPLNPN